MTWQLFHCGMCKILLWSITLDWDDLKFGLNFWKQMKICEHGPTTCMQLRLDHSNALMLKRCNSSADALELHLYCNKLSIWSPNGYWEVFSNDSWNPGIQMDGLVQERHKSIANTLEFCLSCTNPSRSFLPDWSMILLPFLPWGKLHRAWWQDWVLC